MKNCIVALSVLLTTTLYGQEQPAREVKVTKLQPALIQNSPSANPKDSLAGMTVELCEYVINAIDQKVEYIKNDQTEHEKALASGWYDRMAVNRAAWVADRDELLRRKNNAK
jgi:Na+/phosphate symporter